MLNTYLFSLTHSEPPPPVVVVIGFNQTVYTVREDQRSVEVTVSVLDGELDLVEDNVIVELTTSDLNQGEICSILGIRLW